MIEIFRNMERLSLAAAELFRASAERAVARRGRFTVIVSGGETPRRTYELLAEGPFRQRVPWDRVHLFLADERCVPATDLRSNFRMIKDALLDSVPLPENHVHPIECGTNPVAAARTYESSLRSHFGTEDARLDLVILGMGEDGHTASLFPGSPLIDEKIAWVAPAKKPGEAIMRVTLTPLLLNRADEMVFLVAGRGKAATLHRALEGHHTPDQLPAQSVRPNSGRLRWYIDESAAVFLSPGKAVRSAT